MDCIKRDRRSLRPARRTGAVNRPGAGINLGIIVWKAIGSAFVFTLSLRIEPLMYRSLFLAAAAMVALPASEAAAEVPLTGFFIAREACPALQSLRIGTNPVVYKTEPG